MRRTLALATVLLVFSGSAEAQSRFGAELRGGAAFPQEDVGATSLETGAGGGLSLDVGLLPHLRLHAGWEWYSFDIESPFVGADNSIVDTGYDFGLTFQHPVLERVGGWVKASGVYRHVELEVEDEDDVAGSDHALGWSAGAGLRVSLTDRLALTPGVRYRAFSTDLELPTAVEVDMKYVGVDIGLAWSFGAPDMAWAARR